MSTLPITRTLWYETDGRHLTLSQAELHQQRKPLVVLGEPGMGKTHLLEWLAHSPDYAFCSARKLINRHDPRTLLGDARVLVIDALDEVSTRKDGEAVDLVLRRLGELGYPRFILSCRVADWRSATGMEAIREQYEDEDEPLELHLEPFTDGDAISFLGTRVGAEAAQSIVDHFYARGLSGFLRNPQTLELIVDVAGTGPLPETRGELFERAVTVLRVETSKAKADRQLPPEAALNAAGAAFAALILTGSEAIVRTAEANISEGDISIAVIRRLPGGEFVDDVIGTRLFKANGADRFGYWHRRIGEFLGARWLAKLADTDRKRRRMLSLFQSYGLVPASLRGVHAWLVREPALAKQVIAADPMGVVEYGDADNLTADQGRCLLNALQILAKRNPDFCGWGPYSLQGIIQPGLMEDVRALLTDAGTPFGFQTLILEALRTAPSASQLENELHALVLDQNAAFASRRRAAEALAGMRHAQDWQTIVTTLLAQGDELALRLAIEVMDEVGYRYFEDDLIADLIVSFAKCESRTIGVLSGPEDHLPDSRIDGVLNRLSETVKALGYRYQRPGNRELTDFMYRLITRRLVVADIEPGKLWSWLEPFDSDAGGDRKTRERLSQLLQEKAALRLATLRHVLLRELHGGTLRGQCWQLTDRSAGFAPTPGDIIALLGEFDPSNIEDERWRDLVQLTQHDHENGVEVRAAAYPFADGRPEQIAWLEGLAEPYVPEWQVKQSQRKQQHREQQATQHAEQRLAFTGRLDAIRQGEYGSIVDLAMAYLGMYHDIGDDDVPAHERVRQWLGSEIDSAAQVGFEAFLTVDPPHPSADEIASSFAQGKQWEAGYIIVAALAERRRKGVGFGDLTDERLLAGMFVLNHTKIAEHAGIDRLNEAVESEVRSRGLWTSAMRRYLEPQLQARKTYVDGLRALMHDEANVQVATDLAAEWLVHYLNLPSDPEVELVDRLIRSGKFSDLRSLYAARLGPGDSTRRLDWASVALLVDFEAMAATLSKGSLEPELLWHIQDRAGGGYHDHLIKLSAEQLEWFVTSFRTLWPMTGYPNHVRVGRRNSWDASDFLQSLIRRLGTDAGEAATSALRRLADSAADGYTPTIRAVAAEQARLRVESAYTPPTLAALEAIARDRAPASVRDLQAYMLEELEVVQDKIKSDDVESWRGFYDDGHVPYDEERCRDHLLGLLRQGSLGVTLEPETHVAGDKEVDITCATGPFRLPIEIKGQWHPKLWQAADTQLDRLYAGDWRADGCGIYLALWFGDQVPRNKTLHGPGRGSLTPATPEQLRELLASGSRAAREGRVSIVVLDLTRGAIHTS